EGLDVGCAGQRVDADTVVLPGFSEIGSRRLAGLVIVRPDVVHRAQTIGRVDAAGIVDDERNTSRDDGLKGRVHRLGNPVRADDRVSALVDGLTDKFGRVHAEIVVALRPEPRDRAALRLGDYASILGAALDD